MNGVSSKRKMKRAPLGLLLLVGVMATVFVVAQDLRERLPAPSPVRIYGSSPEPGRSISLRWAYENPRDGLNGVMLIREDEGGRRDIASLDFSRSLINDAEFQVACLDIPASAAAPPKPVTLDGRAEYGALQDATARARTSQGPGEFEVKLAKELEKAPTLKSFRQSTRTQAEAARVEDARSGAVGRGRLVDQSGAASVAAGVGRPNAIPTMQQAPSAQRMSQSNQPTADEIRQTRLQFTAAALKAGMQKAQEYYGQAFVDQNVIPGKTYTYRLIQRGTDRELASIKIAAGVPPAIAAPDLQVPVQMGQRLVGLHFKPGATAKEEDYGMLEYEVIRQDSRGEKVLSSNVALGYTKLDALSESAGIVTFTDSDAPASGPTRYRVRAVDLFGVRGVPAEQRINMQDLASPLQIGAVAVRRTSSASGLIHSARAFWIAPKLDTDQRTISPNDLSMRVLRTDEEKATTVLVPSPMNAQESVLPLDVLGELIPQTEVILQSLAKTRALQKLQGTGAQPTSADVQSEREILGALTLAEFRVQRPDLIGEMLAGVQLTDIYMLFDQNPPPDTHITYAVVPTLNSTGFSASETRSAKIGIPAKVVPGMPTMTTLVDAAVQSTGSVVVPGVSMTNVVRLQPNVGMRAGIQARRTNDFAPGMSPRQAASQRISALRTQNLAALPKTQFQGGSNLGSGGRNATVSDFVAQAGPQARPGGNLAAPAASTQIRVAAPLAPMNYGRRVTIRWTGVPYTSPVQYRVYRATGTGFVKPADPAAKPTGPVGLAAQSAPGSLMTRANELRATSSAAPTAAPRTSVGQATRRAVDTESTPRLDLATRREGITRIGTKERLFFKDVEPARSEYVLLGETKPGEVQFVDLTPLSQSATYYYFVEPVNRWGQLGAPAKAKSIKVLPSALPSTPTILGASTSNESLDSSAPLATTPVIKIKIAANLEEEMVIRYEIYRTEIAAARPAVPAPNTATNSTGVPIASTDLTAPKRNIQEYGMGDLVLIPSAAPLLNTLVKLHDRTSQATLSASALSSAALSSLQAVQAVSTVTTPSFTLVQTYQVKPTDGAQIEITDASVSGGKAYLYYVKAVSAANLSSGASSSLDAIAALPEAVPPTLLGKTFKEDDGIVTITLGISAPTTRAFSIKRSVEGGQLTPMGVVQRAGNGAQMIYQDETVIGGRSYVYEFRAIDQSGSTSRQPLLVPINPAP